MRVLGKALLWLLAAFGLLGVLVVGSLWLVFRGIGTDGLPEAALPDRYVLRLPLEDAFPEQAAALPFPGLRGRHMSLPRVVAAIDAAAADPHVAGLVATLGDSGRALAQAQELSAAIGRFRATGKPAVAFADTLGEGSAATVDTYLASAFDKVVLQPSGMVALTGFAAEVPFAEAALDNLGIDSESGQRWEYKTAVDSLIRDDMSDAHRASLTTLLGDLRRQAAEGIAKGRRLPVKTVEARMDGLPLLAEEAREAGLIDTLGYWPDALDLITAEAATDAVVRVDRYPGDGDGRHLFGGPKIALITVAGTIHRGESNRGPVGDTDLGGDTVAQAIADALEDEDVRAIVLRVDSPGGSYVASDTVWNAIRRARARKIPVIASLGDVAASGGYFIAMEADHVIARAGTLTGSIGVFAGKPVLTEMWDKLDIAWEGVSAGDHALMWSPNRPFTEVERQWFEGMLDAVYDDFTGKAASARHLSPEALDKAARGRVFTGAQALEVGLVDALGGLPEALAEARDRAGTPEARLVPFPKPKGTLETLTEMLSGGEFLRAASLLSRVATLAEPLAARAGRAKVATQGPALLAPDH
jgi:protease-4